jgi:hypothetical protein
MNKPIPAVHLSLFLTLAFAILSNASAQGGSEAIHRLEREFANVTAHATPFPGIYLLEPHGGQDSHPIMVDEQGKGMANNGAAGWHHLSDNTPYTDSQLTALRARNVRHIPLNEGISIRRGTGPARFVIYSAVDCGYCIQLEKELASTTLNYIVFPTYLRRQFRSASSAVWCSRDPAKVWENLMTKRQRLSQVTAPGCRYPDIDIKAIGGIFKASTPTIIFADGSVRGLYSIADLQQKVKKLSEQNIAF